MTANPKEMLTFETAQLAAGINACCPAFIDQLLEAIAYLGAYSDAKSHPTSASEDLL